MNADIGGILFDKDGTLFDFHNTWVPWAAAFLHRVCDGDDIRAAAIGAEIGFDYVNRSFAPDSIVIASTSGEIVRKLAPSFPDMTTRALGDMLNEEAALAPQAEAVPLIPFLDGLRARGLKIGVATNDAEAPALAHLGANNIVEKFDFIAGFDSGYGGKPAPGQLNAFCEAVGIAPARVAMVGDSTHDLRAGMAAGMTCIGVLTGMAGYDELAPLADIVLPDIGHIPGWLDQQKV